MSVSLILGCLSYFMDVLALASCLFWTLTRSLEHMTHFGCIRVFVVSPATMRGKIFSVVFELRKHRFNVLFVLFTVLALSLRLELL